MEKFVHENNLALKFLLITHSHYDHVSGVKDFKKAFNVPIYSATEEYDHQVSEGDRIPIGTYEITVLATPGHTPDGVYYYIPGSVFVGDALFSGAVGGTASRSQFVEETTHVRQKILSLPENTVIYPGHGAPSLVAIERVFNPFFV